MKKSIIYHFSFFNYFQTEFCLYSIRYFKTLQDFFCDKFEYNFDNIYYNSDIFT